MSGKPSPHSRVEVERAPRHVVTRARERRGLGTGWTASGEAARLPVRRIEPLLAAPIQRKMRGNELAVLEDADFVGQDVHVEDAPAGGGRHAVEDAADAHHAFMRT